MSTVISSFFFFQAEDGIRDVAVTGVQTCALPIFDRAPAGFGAKHLEWSTAFEASLWRPEPLKGRFLVSHNCLRAGKNSRCANCSFRFFLRRRLMAALAVLPSAQGNDNVEHFDATKALVEKMVDDLGRETCFDQTHNRLFGLGSRAEPVLQILVQPLGRRCGHFRTLLGIST